MFNKDVKQSAYVFLSKREHSKLELRLKLLNKNFNIDDIEPVLDALAEQDIQSDLRYGQTVLRKRINKGYGLNYVVAELEQKGLATDTISRVIRDEQIDWFELARHVCETRFGNSEMTTKKDKAKRIRFLQYRGFDFEQISAVLGTDE